ncbi:MAG TPA: hypothetical protein PLO59_04790, partial [Bacteroidia bacterium]|nr:hypothetical protein [Bacteroidia bacterium]
MLLHGEVATQVAAHIGWMGYSALFLVVLISGLGFLFFKEIKPANLKLMLSFTGSFLFALCVMHMIPEVYEADSHIGLYILIGFFSQLLLEFLSEGIEHGHIHVHAHNENKFPFTMMLGLCIHSFLEAMPLASMHHSGDNLLFAIVLHHIPIAIALMSMLVASHISRVKSIICLIIFAAMPP